MRKILPLLIFLLCMGLFSATVYAQEKVVTGVVTGDNRQTLKDVTVTVKGTKTATKTDNNGSFSIRVNENQKLVISSVGYQTREVTVGSGNSVNVTLVQATAQLEEVVVTAMDIKRNPRSLGYSTQTVDGNELKETQRENFLTGLQGRVSGLTLTTTSGTAGASSSIVLRGFNSLSLSNQPLFVIDGVIVDNQTIDENSYGGAGVGMVERGAGLTNTVNRNTDYSNRISDINPNDIESITVLKGPEATALYGSQASSGAILITTRKPKSNKLALFYDNSFRVQSVNRFPEFIDEYSNGTNGDSSEVFRYFGPKYAEGTKLYNNKDAFFKTGLAQTHNLGVEFGIKGSMFRFSTSVFDQEGIVPNNNYKRLNFRLSNTTQLGKIGDITPTISYIKNENNKVLRNSGGFMLGLLIWPNTNDIRNYGDNATKVPLFASSATANSEFDNPLFNVNANKSYDETERINTSVGINLRPTNWLTLAGRFGYETYNTDGYLRYHPLSYFITNATGGLQDNFYRKYTGYNHTITATAKKTITKDLNLRVMVGTMWQDYKTEMYAVSGNGYVDSIRNGVMYKNGVALTKDNYDAILGNGSDSSVTRPASRTRLLRNVYGEYNQQILRQFATFGEIALAYKNYAFLNYTHRFERGSTLPEENRKYNYPGGSLSLIMSDIFPGIKKGGIVNYWKLRTSLASTARLNLPYSTQSVFVNVLSSGGGFAYGFNNNNPDLAPEKQKTYEIGTEIKLFNKINLEATFYNTLNNYQIIEGFRLSYGTGYILNTQNAGSTRNKGIELSLDATPIKTSNFSWNTRVNFAKMWNKVVKLPKNVAEYYIADTWVYGNARAGLQLNGSTTTITSYGYMRNNDGEILINPTTGLPVIDATFRVRGDRNPDFTLGFNNQLSYKSWKLSFLWDLKVGGDVFNGTEMYLTTIGRSKITADRMVPRVIKGVLQDGLENTATPTANKISIIPYDNDLYYRSLPEEAFIEKDINLLRLRDITLSYTFPNSLFKGIKQIKGLSAFFTGNDLVIITNYTGIDPSTNGNTGANRGVGAFGFDFGSLPTPSSFNFGLRASF